MTADLSKPTVFALTTILVCAVAALGQANRRAGREGVTIKPVPSASREPLFSPTVITYSTSVRGKAERSRGKETSKTEPLATAIPIKLATTNNSSRTSYSIKPIVIVYRAYSSPLVTENSARTRVKPAPVPVSNSAARKFSGTSRSALVDPDQPDEKVGAIVEMALEPSDVSTSPHTAARDYRTTQRASTLTPGVARNSNATPEPMPRILLPVGQPFSEGASITSPASDLITASLDPIGTEFTPPSLFPVGDPPKEETLVSVGTAKVVDPASNAVDAVDLNNRAVELTIADQYAEAEALLQRAIDSQPRVGKFHRNLSVLYEEMKQFDKALASARTAAGLSPADPSVLERLCTIELDTHHWTEAVGCYERLGSIQALDTVSTSDFGMALLRAGEVKRSIELLEKAAASTPPVASAINGLGIAYFETKRFEDAAAAFKRAVEITPDRCEFRYNLAVSNLASRNRNAAIGQYNFLKAKDPKLAAQLYKMLFSDMIVTVPKN